MSNQAEVSVLFIFQPREELQKYFQDNLKNYSNVKLIFPPNLEEQTFLKYASEADIIVGWRPSEELLTAAHKLSLFINPGVGVQDLTAIFHKINQTRKVILCNGHGNTYFTAQHAVALLLALTNKIIPHHNWMKEGQWRKGDGDAQSIPLRNRKIGLLGYGAVNTKVHKFLAGFDVEFHVLKRDWNKERINTLPTNVTKYEANGLQKFLREIDILIVALPLTTYTREIIGKKELELLGSNSLLVNVGRGELIEEESLFYALKENIIAGAALDVWYNYNPEPDNSGKKFPSKYPFNELNNVILSPHRGASPMNDLQRWDEIIENIIRFTLGQTNFLNIVDLKNEY
ncbi:MAG TPA: NAD(P)-dependent oxidoreductase [Candidatus Bathyarchaeia archaeon]|nr:NAD(P)-dependent oxidoreductase [Candidatus Bathyarchaeia archaeon]